VPEDFAPPIPMELTFLPGAAERCASISISNDTILEDDELFSVQLDTTDQAVTLSPGSANVTIVDDDGKSLSIPKFHVLQYTLRECMSTVGE